MTVAVVLESAVGGLVLKSGLRIAGTATAGLLGVGCAPAGAGQLGWAGAAGPPGRLSAAFGPPSCRRPSRTARRWHPLTPAPPCRCPTLCSQSDWAGSAVQRRALRQRPRPPTPCPFFALCPQTDRADGAVQRRPLRQRPRQVCRHGRLPARRRLPADDQPRAVRGALRCALGWLLGRAHGGSGGAGEGARRFAAPCGARARPRAGGAGADDGLDGWRRGCSRWLCTTAPASQLPPAEGHAGLAPAAPEAAAAACTCHLVPTARASCWNHPLMRPAGYFWSCSKFTLPIIALSGYVAQSVQWWAAGGVGVGRGACSGE